MLDSGQLNDEIRALNNGDDASRRQAIQALKTRGEQEWATVPKEAMRLLIEWLKEKLVTGTKHAISRQEVVTILANMGPRAEPAISQLIELLKEGVTDRIRELAATALGKIGGEASVAVDPLLNVLLHSRGTLAVHVVRALGDIGCVDQKVRSALVDFWLSPAHSQAGQIQVGTVLCKLKIDAKGLVKLLTSTLMTNKEAPLRQSAAEALAWCSANETDVAPALLTAARSDKDDKVRQVADAGLTQLGLSHEQAINLCLKQLKDSCYAETALRNSGQLAVSALAKALRADESTTREKAARTLGYLGEAAAEAVPALSKSLHDKDLDVRLAAAKGLWCVTKNADLVVPVLVDLLEENRAVPDANESRRRYLQTVIEALRRMGPPAKGAIPALLVMAKDKNRSISESALSAVKEIAPTLASKAGSESRRGARS